MGIDRDKGKVDRAIAEYAKILRESPEDARALLKVGDLQMRKGAPADAVATYFTVAQLYARDGFLLKAVAVHKQIREIVSRDLPGPEGDALWERSTRALTDHYETLGLTDDAAATRAELHARLARGPHGPYR